MDWKRVVDQAKGLIARRGGTESVKEDAEELRDIARGGGTTGDKVKAAAEALREPGAGHHAGGAEPTAPAPPAEPAGSPPPAEPAASPPPGGSAEPRPDAPTGGSEEPPTGQPGAA